MIPLESTVFAFDRDHTVSVNPHPDDDRDAVPLSWVKYLAHGSPADVFASGNQHLRREAAIPGLAWAKVLHDELEGRPFEESAITESGEHYSNYLPERRQGLRTICSVYNHPDSGVDADDLRFVVIDDIDLKDMAGEGWEHYYPWDFVDAFGGLSDAAEAASVCDRPVSAVDCTCGERSPAGTLTVLDTDQQTIHS